MSNEVAYFYDSDLPSDRRRAIVLFPDGTLTGMRRDQPFNSWPPPTTIRENCTFGEALDIAYIAALDPYYP